MKEARYKVANTPFSQLSTFGIAMLLMKMAFNDLPHIFGMFDGDGLPKEQRIQAISEAQRATMTKDLKKLYDHFDRWRAPKNWTDEQFNTALTELFFYWVRERGDSAIGASCLIEKGLAILPSEVEDHEITDRLLSAYRVMEPRWMNYFRTGKEIET